MVDPSRGRVRANGLTFEYLEAGEGPLAVCMHGFPDTPFSYRHLLPALADAGFHAVAPFVRGFAPTELPPLRSFVHSSVMVADQIALAQALDGGPDALLVAHDWGAVGAWGALRRAPDLWGRAVVFNIPPFEILGENLGTYEQIKRSFYFWYFQMQRVIEDRIRQDDFAFIRDIWADWSPGYTADEDLAHIRRALADPTTSGRRWATTGDSSTRPGSAPRSGPPSRPPPGEGRCRSRCSTCTARTTAATHDGREGRAGAAVLRAPVGGGADRGRRPLPDGGAAAGDQRARHRMAAADVRPRPRRGVRVAAASPGFRPDAGTRARAHR